MKIKSLLTNKIIKKSILSIIFGIVIVGGYSILNRNPDFVFDSSSGSITEYLGNKKDVVIPKRIGLTRVKHIGEHAFANNKNIEHINIPEGIISIETSAFNSCKNLEEINFPSSLNYFREYTFDNTSLKNIVVSAGNKYFSSIDGVLFNKDKTAIILYPNKREDKSYIVPNNTEIITKEAFSNSHNLEHINIPETVNFIDSNAFYNCYNLKDIEIPRVEKIQQSTFEGCSSLKEISIPYGVQTICDQAFNGCKALIKITIPESVTEIGRKAFEGCASLNSIIIPTSIKYIREGAFNNCTSLSSFTIPKNIESIDGNIFTMCKNLKNIIIQNNSKFIFKNGLLLRKNDKREIELLTCLLSNSKISIPDDVKKIGNYAFSGVDNLKALSIPSSVEIIGEGAFAGCNNLYSVNLPNSIKTIEKCAFIFCDNITIYVNSLNVDKLVRDSGSRIQKNKIIM